MILSCLTAAFVAHGKPELMMVCFFGIPAMMGISGEDSQSVIYKLILSLGLSAILTCSSPMGLLFLIYPASIAFEHYKNIKIKNKLRTDVTVVSVKSLDEEPEYD